MDTRTDTSKDIALSTQPERTSLRVDRVSFVNCKRVLPLLLYTYDLLVWAASRRIGITTVRG